MQGGGNAGADDDDDFFGDVTPPSVNPTTKSVSIAGMKRASLGASVGRRASTGQRRGSSNTRGRRSSNGGAGARLGKMRLDKAELLSTIVNDTEAKYARISRIQAYDRINEMIPLYNTLRYFGTPEKIDEHIERAQKMFYTDDPNREMERRQEKVSPAVMKTWAQVFLHYAVDTPHGPFLEYQECATLVRNCEEFLSIESVSLHSIIFFCRYER